MKRHFLILLVLIICSCNSENHKLDQRIIGDWGIYVQIGGGNVIYCNACPRINFKDNKTAILTLPGNEEYYYNWSSKENKIAISLQNEKDSYNYFVGSEFDFEINNKEDYIELKLLKSKEGGYILRKGK